VTGTGAVSLRGLRKRYGDRAVVDDVSLEVRPGEFFSLLGPSGCGKTTTLRMIGGFERPDAGAVAIDGRDVTDDEPEARPVNTVFQNYALFPHLDVADNVAFGLRFARRRDGADMRRRGRLDEVERRVGEALELVQLGSFGARRVHQLSGGEQQRVALARALVLEPTVLLLDEPLGALDAQLRTRLQVELSELQRRLGITFVYVTHDQQEAFTMSDRIGVMRDGRLLQVGAPREIYERPASVEVARFIGAANLLDGTVSGPGAAEVAGERFAVPQDAPRGEGIVMVRPERIVVGRGDRSARVERVTFAGSTVRVDLRVGAVALVAEVPNDGSLDALRAGDTVPVDVPADAVRVLSPRRS
jgi:spermidine/putrescine transport system ATP-binding protein